MRPRTACQEFVALSCVCLFCRKLTDSGEKRAKAMINVLCLGILNSAFGIIVVFADVYVQIVGVASVGSICIHGHAKGCRACHGLRLPPVSPAALRHHGREACSGSDAVQAIAKRRQCAECRIHAIRAPANEQHARVGKGYSPTSTGADIRQTKYQYQAVTMTKVLQLNLLLAFQNRRSLAIHVVGTCKNFIPELALLPCDFRSHEVQAAGIRAIQPERPQTTGTPRKTGCLAWGMLGSLSAAWRAS